MQFRQNVDWQKLSDDMKKTKITLNYSLFGRWHPKVNTYVARATGHREEFRKTQIADVTSSFWVNLKSRVLHSISKILAIAVYKGPLDWLFRILSHLSSLKFHFLLLLKYVDLELSSCLMSPTANQVASTLFNFFSTGFLFLFCNGDWG